MTNECLLKLCSVDFDLLEIQSIYDTISREVLNCKKIWKSNDFLYIHLHGNFDIETHLNNKNNCSSVRNSYETVANLDSGILYLIKFPITNYYCFIPKKSYNIFYEKISSNFDLKGYIWFAVLSPNGGLNPHTDNLDWRYHYVVKSDGTSFLEFHTHNKISKHYFQEGQQFLMNPRVQHSVRNTISTRVHLIASVKEKI